MFSHMSIYVIGSNFQIEHGASRISGDGQRKMHCRLEFACLTYGVDSDTNDQDTTMSCHSCLRAGNISHQYHGVAFCEKRFGRCIRSRHRMMRNGSGQPN